MIKYAEFLDRIIWCKRQINPLIDTDGLEIRGPDHSVQKVAAITVSAGALECFLRSLCERITTEIEINQVLRGKISPKISGVAFMTEFQSITDSKYEKKVARISDFFSKSANIYFKSDSSPVSYPFDNKTIRSYHIENYWKLIDGIGSPFPSDGNHSLALNDLATIRDEIGHGRMYPGTVHGSKTAPEILTSITKIEEIGTILENETAVFFAGKKYALA